MSHELRVPSIFRYLTEGESAIVIDSKDGMTVRSALAAADEQYPGIVAKITDDEGDLHRHINVFVDGEDARYLGGLGMELAEQDSYIELVPAVAGG